MKLSRITLDQGNINTFSEDKNFKRLGPATLKPKFNDPKILDVKTYTSITKGRYVTSGSKIYEVACKKNLNNLTDEQFLSLIDRHLQDNNLFLIDARYHFKRLGGIIPQRVSGNLY